MSTAPLAWDRDDRPATWTEVAAAPDHLYPQLLDDLLRRYDGFFRRVGMGVCRHFRVDLNTWHDDFTSLARIEAYKLINQCRTEPHRAAEIGSFDATVTYRTQAEAQRFFDSTAGASQLSGRTTLLRRIREAERTRADLTTELGREPTDLEVVEATNRRLRENNTKIGQLTLAELHTPTTALPVDEHITATPATTPPRPVEPGTVMDQAFDELEGFGHKSGKKSARLMLWNALAETHGAPTAVPRLTYRAGFEARRVIKNYPGGLDAAIDALLDGRLDAGVNALLSPYEPLDGHGRAAVANLYRTYRPYAADLWRSAIHTATLPKGTNTNPTPRNHGDEQPTLW